MDSIAIAMRNHYTNNPNATHISVKEMLELGIITSETYEKFYHEFYAERPPVCRYMSGYARPELLYTSKYGRIRKASQRISGVNKSSMVSSLPLFFFIHKSFVKA